MIQTWKLTKTKPDEIRFDDESSLDAITRQLPEGWYSTFRTFDSCSRVIGLSAHLKRLPHADASALRRNLTQLLEPYCPGEARIRVIETHAREFYISIEPLKPLPGQIYEKGVRVETTTIQRRDPRVKSTAFITASDTERKHLTQEGIFEALLVKSGRILEGMTSNFFYIPRAEQRLGGTKWKSKSASTAGSTSINPSAQRGILCTALRGVLYGVTRSMVIRAAHKRGMQVRYRALKLDQLPDVNEAFITSSSRGIVPVIQIDAFKVGQGRVGDDTKMLMQAYNELVIFQAEKIA